MTVLERDFDALFAPRSVAVLGASNLESKYGNWLSVQAVGMVGERDVHLVNVRGESVLGMPAVRTLAEIGSPVDLVAIAVPAAGFEQAVDDSLAAGARAIVGVTAGFAELGDEGRAVQDRIVRKVRDAGAMLVGPNCLGVVDSTSALTLAANPVPAGRVAVLSQSGNVVLELGRLFAERGLGFSRFVSLGNQADVTAAELIRECVRHEGTDVIAVYCEDFGDGRAFVQAAEEAAAAGKPVLLLTVGGSAASIRGAQSHTGSMTSGIAVVDAACRRAGIVRVETPRRLAEAALVLQRLGPGLPVERVAVVADGGGHAGIAADVLESAGLTVPHFSDDLATRLRAILTPSANVANPIDVAGAGERDVYSFERVLDTVLADPDVDAVVFTGYFGGYAAYGPKLAREELDVAARMAALARASGKPVLVQTLAHTSEAARVLAEHGTPVFAAIEDAVDALAAVGRSRPRPPGVRAAGDISAQERIALDDYWSARMVLERADVPFTPAGLVGDRDEARAEAERVGFPVVLKALGLVHKSDSGGVALGLADGDAVAAAFDEMDGRLRAPGYVVEHMAAIEDAVDLIVGTQRDPRFGPIAMVGLGGLFTEVLRDVAFALSPVDAENAEEMLDRLRSRAMLDGLRGRPAADVAAAADVIRIVSALADDHPEISEIEINPLRVYPWGAIALDARIILDPAADAATTATDPEGFEGLESSAWNSPSTTV